MRAKPLHGIRVLDLTRLLPGAVCTLHLADMGADVIKIEDPWQGDYGRALGARDDAMSPYFLVSNRNKRSLKLDMKQAPGRQAFLDLATTTDVVIENFRPGVVDKLGIGYEPVRVLNPGIVYCSISGYGQTGPLRESAGHDINYCAYAGITEQIGLRGGAPALPNFQIADLAGGALSAAMGILAALLDVQRTGKGRYIDVSMTDCALAHSVVPLVAMVVDGHTRPRGADTLTGGSPYYGLYATADGRYMALGALEKKFWQRFCEQIERPDLIAKHEVSGADADKVQAELATMFRSNTQDYWTKRFANIDCCVTPVLTLTESMGNEQLQARGMFVTQGDVPQFAFPLKLSDFEFTIGRPPPEHGEHSKEILAEAGYNEDRLAALEVAGVI